jgi:hypothetical protein
MAMGSTANQAIGTVKSTCNSLEVSPSHKSATSPVYNKGREQKPPHRGHSGKTHAGHRGTKETPEKFGGAHHKRGH